MKFRPCIDLHNGKVKQIIGSTLTSRAETLKTNFTADLPPSYYAAMYQRDGLEGGHVIMLGPGNEEAAMDALGAFPHGLHIGGGITPANGPFWLDRGAAAVIVTSYVFRNGQVHQERLVEMMEAVGRDRMVLDLSCRKKDDRYFVVTDRWQIFTDVEINPKTLDYLAEYCAEFLIHAADVEGKCAGIAEDLVKDLGKWTSIPTTYAGGVRSLEDLYRVQELGRNRLDVTAGSCLDIFGGSGIKYDELVRFNNACRQTIPLSS